MCRANFSGKLELAFLPYSGGFYEQPAGLMERMLLILDCLNSAIHDKQEEEKEKEKK